MTSKRYQIRIDPVFQIFEHIRKAEAMMSKRLSASEIKYLEVLPVVEFASADTVSFSRAFQTYCMRRCVNGDDPELIFATVGLPSSLVGKERIKRCVRRWQKDKRLMSEIRNAEGLGDDGASIRYTLILANAMKIEELQHTVDSLQRQLDRLADYRKASTKSASSLTP